MNTEELETRLMRIVKEQPDQLDLGRMRALSRKCEELLNTLKEGTTTPIDVFYVLSGGTDAQELFVDEVLDEPNTVYFEPHIFDYEGKELRPRPGRSLDEVISVKRGDLNPRNFALIVDDGWESGITASKTVAYLEKAGYQRDKIFIFHYLGSLSFTGLRSAKFGFVVDNPVLVSAATMLDFFDHPEKYE